MIRSLVPFTMTATALALTPAIAPTAATAAEVQITATNPVIELSVHEEVDVAPDMVTIGAGVTTQAPTAVEALRQNSAEMTKVIDRIKALGVAERDIQTIGINLGAQYDYDQQQSRQIFRGYQASNRVSVKLRKVERAGAVLDALVAAGATDISGPDFSVEDDSAAKAEARRNALAKAQAMALEYARAAGYSGVRLIQVNERIDGGAPQPPRPMAMSLREAPQAAPVQPGVVGAGVDIGLTYEMTNR